MHRAPGMQPEMIDRAEELAAANAHLRTLAGRLAAANADLDRAARAARSAERAARAAQLAAEVSQALAHAGMETRSTMQEVADRLAAAIGDVCIIGQAADDGTYMAPMAFAAADPEVRERFADVFSGARIGVSDRSISGRAMASGQPVIATGEAFWDEVHPLTLATRATVPSHSAVAVPMRGDGRIVGAVIMVRHQRPEPYHPDDVQLLDDVAQRAGLALVNARRHATVVADEERFRAALEHSPLGTTIVSLDPETPGRFLWVNRKFCELVGYSAEQLQTMSYTDVTFSEDHEGDRRAMARMVAGRADHGHREKRYVRSDGTTIWVGVNVSRMPGDGPACYIAQIEDVTALKRAQDDLVFRALHDPLTGLANRYLVMDHLRLELTRRRRVGTGVAVLYVDVDRFKEINDALGHEAGDEVLRHIACRLTASVRSPDTVGRLGGDEFAIVCPDVDAAAAVAVAERVRTAIADPLRVAGRDLEVTVSVGVATTRTSSADPERLLQQADEALYQSKRRGRDRWELYEEALQRQAVERLTVQAELRRALSDGWLRLHYQPVVDLAAGRMVGVEALLRMEHPERGILSPDRFIGVAEESDLIVPIGEWVLHEACAQLARWGAGPDFRAAINVSGRELSDLATPDRVLAAVARTGVAPESLGLEITERVLIEGGCPVTRGLARLADAGVGLAIDDFGTGYSSLSYLQRFPVDALKIDRSFVQGLGVRHADRAIVSSVIALCQALGLTAIAEGVETDGQLAALGRLGCTQAQGYHLGRPVPAAVIGRMLAEPPDRVVVLDAIAPVAPVSPAAS